MATSATKIALGVGCGILLATLFLVGSCVACVGFGVNEMAEESARQDAAKSQLQLGDDWKFIREEFHGEITGTVRNGSDREFNSVIIEFNLYDSAGSQVGTASDTARNLEPGASWNFSASVFEDSASEAKFKGFSAY